MIKELLTLHEELMGGTCREGSSTVESSLKVSELESLTVSLTQFLTVASSSTAWTPEMWWLRGNFHMRNGDSMVAKDCLMRASRLLQVYLLGILYIGAPYCCPV